MIGYTIGALFFLIVAALYGAWVGWNSDGKGSNNQKAANGMAIGILIGLFVIFMNLGEMI